jgi:putative FmdB family regulatory protein
MPIYEYVCEDCNTRFEHLVLRSEKRVACPSCGSKRHALQFSVFAAPASTNGASGGNDKSAAQAASPARSCGCGAGGCGRH